MGATYTLEQLNTALQTFADKVEETRKSEADIDDAFIWLKRAIGAGEMGLAGFAFTWITDRDPFGWVDGKEEEIKTLIRKLLQALEEAVKALKAPLALLKVSGVWLELKSEIGAAQNNEVTRGDLTGEWLGSASRNYQAVRSVQDTAMDSLGKICDTANTQIVKVSDAAWTFYSEVSSQLVTFVAALGAAISKIATVVTASWGISDAIDLIKKITEMATAAFKTLTSALRTEVVAIDAISSATSNPKGFLNNKWPAIGNNDKFDVGNPNTEKWNPQ